MISVREFFLGPDDPSPQGNDTQQCAHPGGYTNWRGRAICGDCGADCGVSPCVTGVYE